MALFSHVFIGTNDLASARAFYDAALTPLGVTILPAGEKYAPYHKDGATLLVGIPRNGEAATCANGGTVGFVAPDAAAVDAFHAAGLAHGGSDAGAPGPREMAGGRYGAYLRDPEGNKICAFVPPAD